MKKIFTNYEKTNNKIVVSRILGDWYFETFENDRMIAQYKATSEKDAAGRIERMVTSGWKEI